MIANVTHKYSTINIITTKRLHKNQKYVWMAEVNKVHKHNIHVLWNSLQHPTLSVTYNNPTYGTLTLRTVWLRFTNYDSSVIRALQMHT